MSSNIKQTMCNKAIFFSILIPAYKTTFLEECLDSILTQSYKNFEVIIVDDCSPNDIKRTVDKFKSNKLRYYRNERNFGAVNVVDNWNRCLDYATGEYCICMGDDDALPPKALEEYKAAIEKFPEISVFHAKTIIIDSYNNPIYVVNTRAEHESCIAFIRHRMDGDLQFVGDFCYNTRRLKEKGGYVKFPLAWGSDDVTAYMMAEKLGIVNLSKPSFYYRANGQSISTTGNVELKILALEDQKSWIGQLIMRLNCTDIQEKLSLEYVQKHLEDYFNKKLSGYISEEIRVDKFKIISWLVNKRKFKVNKKTLIYGLLRAFK